MSNNELSIIYCFDGTAQYTNKKRFKNSKSLPHVANKDVLICHLSYSAFTDSNYALTKLSTQNNCEMMEQGNEGRIDDRGFRVHKLAERGVYIKKLETKGCNGLQSLRI